MTDPTPVTHDHRPRGVDQGAASSPIGDTSRSLTVTRSETSGKQIVMVLGDRGCRRNLSLGGRGGGGKPPPP